jgi:hypothetical protein
MHTAGERGVAGVRQRVSAAELIRVPQSIVDGIMAQAAQVTRGLGGALAWPGLLRELDRLDPSLRQ